MKRKKAYALVLAMALLVSVISGCASGTPETSSPPAAQQGDAPAEASSNAEPAPAQEADSEQATVEMFSYNAASKSFFEKAISEFEAANPNIKIELDIMEGDNYKTTLKSRLATSQAPDIMGVHPGINAAIAYAEAGYLETLTNEAFIQGIEQGALRMCSYDKQIYGLPLDTVYIGVIYNKKIFADNGISVPTKWSDFISVCETLKGLGIAPLSIGLKELWISQLTAYAIAPTVIYKQVPDFDDQMYAGNKKFNGEEWTATMEKYLALTPYQNDGFMGTGYEEQLAMLVDGSAAMTVAGSFSIDAIKQFGTDIDIGMFTFPASDTGENWTSAATGQILGISADSDVKDAAKQFFAYISQDEVYKEYLLMTNGSSVRASVINDTDPILSEFTQTITGTYHFLDQNWPAGVQDVFMKGIQEAFAGKALPDVLGGWDAEWATRTAS